MTNILRRAAGRAAARSLMEGDQPEEDAVETAAEEDANDASGNEDDGDMEGEDDAPDASDDGGDEEQADTTAASAAAAATARCAAIITSKEGMANPALAQQLAFNADAETGTFMSAKSAIAILATAPAATNGGRLNGLMAAHKKTPGADAPNADNGDTSMNAMMKRRNAEHATG